MLRNLLLLGLLVGSSLAISPFPELQQQFADHSREVEPQLQEFRQENNEVRLDLSHWIVREIGNLTLEMRRITDETWTYIENHEDVNEECLVDLRDLFDYYVWIGELDIMYCAEDMDYYMRYDATYRFNPRIGFMQRENSRAVYQTVQSLGRNQFLDNMGDTTSELHEELDYYRNLWDGYQGLLRDELKAMEPFAEDVQNEMYSWQTYAIDWHHIFMNWAIEDIEYYCGDWNKA
ncbi:uncharacterized protein LOC135707909 [Ochlerotatus camptorhynchus]|uniref:uncharacterized protein LOC135707909 n=1 Tax=Ochlerotatus camptorhynchus TaxID=644619 RepID=UPI0031CE8AC1